MLPNAQIERLLQPYVGCNKGFGDVQKDRLDGAWTNKPSHIKPTDTPATLPGVTRYFRMHGALVYLF